MKKPIRFCAAILACSWLFLMVEDVSASGFFHPEVGARSIARAGATAIGGDDLSAFYVNIANLANVDGTNLYLACIYDFFHTYYRREPYQDAVRNSNPFDPIQFAGISSDFGLDTWTFGFAVYGPYGVTNRWPTEGPQRYNIIEANAIQVYYSLGAAWNPTDWIRVGAKASLVNFKLINYYGFSVLGDRNPAFDVVGEFSAWTDFVPGWGAGIVVAPIPHWLEVGFSYLAPFDVVVEGKVKGDLPPLYGAILGYDVYEDDIRIPLPYPPIYRFGARFIYHELFDVEASAMYIPWTRLPYYDVDFENEDIIADFKYPLEWRDTWNYRLGGTYRYNKHFRFHGGVGYEESANPPEIAGTEADRRIIGTGLTMSFFGMDLDLSYTHIWQEDVETPLPGADFESELDDGRGRYKSSYDALMGALTINFERIYKAYNGHEPW